MIRIRQYLMSQGLWDEEREQQLLADCAAQVDEAVEEYLNTPRMPVSAMFDHMYEELPESLLEQREYARRYEGSGGGH